MPQVEAARHNVRHRERVECVGKQLLPAGKREAFLERRARKAWEKQMSKQQLLV